MIEANAMSVPQIEARDPPGTSRLLESSRTVLVPTPSEDPNDPLNWSKSRKYINLGFVLVSTIAIFTALMMQIIFWQQMIDDLHVTYDQLNASAAANSVGLALGCLFFIPLTKKYGCRSTYVISTGVIAGLCWWSSRLQTAAEIYVTNLLFGLCISLNETASEMTIADLFFVHERGTVNGLYVVAVMLGNFICPMIAGLQAAAQGWRWTYYTAGIVMTLLFFLLLFFYEETKYIPVCNAEQLGAPHDESLPDDDMGQGPMVSKSTKGEQDIPAPSPDLSTLEQRPVSRKMSYFQRLRFFTRTEESIWGNYTTPLRMARFAYVLFVAFQVANCVAFLVLLTSVNSMVFSAPPYSFNAGGVGLMLLGPFVGNILGSLYGGLLGDWTVVQLAKRNNGIFEPEMRLYILPFPSLCTGAGLILFGIAADRGWHWIYPSIGGALFGFGMASMMDVVCTLAIDIYESLTADAFIFITFLRNIPSIGISFGVVSWVSSIGLTKLFVISGCVCSAVCLTVIPFMIWGRRIRIAEWQAFDVILQRQGTTSRH